MNLTKATVFEKLVLLKNLSFMTGNFNIFFYKHKFINVVLNVFFYREKKPECFLIKNVFCLIKGRH